MKILKIIAISVMALALPLSAYAQGRGIDRKKEKEDTALDIEKRKAEEKQYKTSLSNITTKEYDPWAGARKPSAENSRCEKKTPARPAGQ